MQRGAGCEQLEGMAGRRRPTGVSSAQLLSPPGSVCVPSARISSHPAAPASRPPSTVHSHSRHVPRARGGGRRRGGGAGRQPLRGGRAAAGQRQRQQQGKGSGRLRAPAAVRSAALQPAHPWPSSPDPHAVRPLRRRWASTPPTSRSSRSTVSTSSEQRDGDGRGSSRRLLSCSASAAPQQSRSAALLSQQPSLLTHAAVIHSTCALTPDRPAGIHTVASVLMHTKKVEQRAAAAAGSAAREA